MPDFQSVTYIVGFDAEILHDDILVAEEYSVRRPPRGFDGARNLFVNVDVTKGPPIGARRLGAPITLPSFLFRRDIARCGSRGRSTRTTGRWRIALGVTDNFLELL